MRVLLTAGCAAAVALAAPGLARAADQTLTFRSQAVTIEPYAVVQATQFAPSPSVDGYVVEMTADVVDAAGNKLPLQRVMLHHVVFAKLGVPDTTCPALPAQRFYGSGEERFELSLPQGYGYPNRGSDYWGLLYMLMNHNAKRETVYVQYTVRYVTGEQLTPLKPFWLDIHNCSNDPVFDVPGTGPQFSTYSRHVDYQMPEGGRIVTLGGHIHGGGLRLDLADRTCGRPLYTSLPTWGLPKVTPVMHEPGPKHTSTFHSAEGLPVSAGDALRLTALYDNSLPHTRVMGIMLLYVAPDVAVSGCSALPTLDADPLSNPGAPPRIVLPLLKRPSGPVFRNVTGSWVSEYLFQRQRVAIRRGATFTWRFGGALAHNVTLANGPVGFSSPSIERGRFRYRFTRRGTYRLFCSLHPTRMTQVIAVR